jgi:hypothetical protein
MGTSDEKAEQKASGRGPAYAIAEGNGAGASASEKVRRPAAKQMRWAGSVRHQAASVRAETRVMASATCPASTSAAS